MKSAWEEVKPNHIYQVFKCLPITEEGNDGLLYLYQPIIGQNALALYYTLLGDQGDRQENEFVHIDILNALNVGLPDFLEARKKLEAVGLLSVFMKEDPEFDRMFLYQLEEPLHPQAFIKDEMYSYLLWNQVGERKFNQLVERFKPKKIDVSEYQEITATFSDIYGGLDQEAFLKKQEKLEGISQSYQQQSQPSITLDDKLDWKFLLDIAHKKYIIAENFTFEFKRQLTLYANLYGFDELTLVNLMAEVVSLNDGMVDQRQLASLIQRRQGTSVKKEAITLSGDAKIRRFNTLRQTGFTEADIELIDMSETTAPTDFLQAIKQEKHSFVTDSEQWLLRSLVEKSPLPNSVINVLMHYVLVVQKNSSLQSNFVNKIATDWSELGIQSPEAAIQHVRQLVKEAKTRQTKPQRTNNQGNYRKPVRKEKLPDWVENPMEEIEDVEKQAEINQRLQKFLQRKEGDS